MLAVIVSVHETVFHFLLGTNFLLLFLAADVISVKI